MNFKIFTYLFRRVLIDRDSKEDGFFRCAQTCKT